MFDFSTVAGHIDGWLTKREGRLLYDAARKVPTGHVIVEIGSWKGRSTVCLAEGSRDGNRVRVYAIDPHQGSHEHRRLYGPTDTFEEFQQNIAVSGSGDLVEPVRTPSVEAVPRVSDPVSLLFLDGAHNYRAIKTDLDVWLPRLADGGRVAVHDSWQLFGPSLATACLLLFSPHVKSAHVIDTVTIFERSTRVTLADRIRNAGVLAYRCVVGFVGWLRLRNSRARLARMGLARP